MSILNIQVLADRILIAVDTKAATGTVYSELTKFHIIEPGNVVLAGRGVAAFQYLLFTALAAKGGGMDELVSAMMNQIEACMEYLRLDAESKKCVDPMPSEGQDIALVGWSESRQRLLAIRWYKPPGKARFQVSTISGWSLAPGMSRDPPEISGHLDSEEKMIELMNRQVAYCKRHNPNEAIGGRPVFVDVTKDRISVTRGAPFSDSLS